MDYVLFLSPSHRASPPRLPRQTPAPPEKKHVFPHGSGAILISLQIVELLRGVVLHTPPPLISLPSLPPPPPLFFSLSFERGSVSLLHTGRRPSFSPIRVSMGPYRALGTWSSPFRFDCSRLFFPFPPPPC